LRLDYVSSFPMTLYYWTDHDLERP
jgi:hypothetical protein